MKDLVILAADKNAQFALKGVLERPRALGVRKVSFDIRVHFGRDGGVRKTGADILRVERHRFNHGMLILDFEGSGSHATNGLDLERELDERLRVTWGENAKAIVIDPELDIWMWGSNNTLADVLQWEEDEAIRDWLLSCGFDIGDSDKPVRPKEAMEEVLRRLRRPRSSALYEQIARAVSLKRCSDSAFGRFKNQLITWFGSALD